MCIETTRREFTNVIAGSTVDGRPSELPPLSFSKSENVFATAASAADLMLRVLASSRAKLTSETRTQLLWKFAAYVSKAGARPQAPSLATRAVHAAEFIVARPRLITSRIGMGKIIELSQQELRSRENRLARETVQSPEQNRPEPAFIPTRYAPENSPPRPIIWLSCDHNYRLEELVHPAHLVEEGVHMHHCLSWKTEEYWRSILNGRRRIYSLRRGPKYLATFTHLDQSLTELTIQCPPDDAVINALADAYRYIDRIYGPLGFALRDGNHSRLRAVLREYQQRFH